jgi:hypothetical protein
MVVTLQSIAFCDWQDTFAVAGGFKHQDRPGADQPMRKVPIHDFGLVDDKDDVFEFYVGSVNDDRCRLVAVEQTERGPRRTEVAAIPARMWETVNSIAVRELSSEMRERERGKNKPLTLHSGLNRLSPLVGRELGVLLMALMEEGASERIDSLVAAWRELAREERWWLYGKAAAQGQRQGIGWRRALFHALSETSDTRSAPVDEAQKKSSGSTVKQLWRRKNAQTKKRWQRHRSQTNQRIQENLSNPEKKKESEKGRDVRYPKTMAR